MADPDRAALDAAEQNRSLSEEIATLNRRLAGVTAARDAALLDAVAIGAITAAGGSVALLLPHVCGRLKVVESEDGAAAAKPAGGHEDVAALLAEMKQTADFAPAFAAAAQPATPPQPSGSGAAPSAQAPERAVRLVPRAEMGRHLEAIAKGEARVV